MRQARSCLVRHISDPSLRAAASQRRLLGTARAFIFEAVMLQAPLASSQLSRTPNINSRYSQGGVEDDDDDDGDDNDVLSKAWVNSCGALSFMSKSK